MRSPLSKTDFWGRLFILNVGDTAWQMSETQTARRPSRRWIAPAALGGGAVWQPPGEFGTLGLAKQWTPPDEPPIRPLSWPLAPPGCAAGGPARSPGRAVA